MESPNMSQERIEAAALAVRNGIYQDRPVGEIARAVLDNADAHDAANSVHRVSLDHATIERAARLLCAANNLGLDYWERYSENSLIKEKFREQARAVLAAAVKEGP